MEGVQSKSVAFTPQGMVTTNTVIVKNTVTLTAPKEEEIKVKGQDILLAIGEQASYAYIEKLGSLQTKLPETFLMTFKENEDMEDFLEMKQIKVNETNLQIDTFEPITWTNRVERIPITIFGAPYHMHNDDIINKLTNYCDVLDVKRQVYKLFPSVESGVRTVYTQNIHAQIPSRLYVCGFKLTIRYEGQIRNKRCYNCGLSGHLGADCKQPDKRLQPRADAVETTNSNTTKTLDQPDMSRHETTVVVDVERPRANSTPNRQEGGENILPNVSTTEIELVVCKTVELNSPCTQTSIRPEYQDDSPNDENNVSGSSVGQNSKSSASASVSLPSSDRSPGSSFVWNPTEDEDDRGVKRTMAFSFEETQPKQQYSCTNV